MEQPICRAVGISLPHEMSILVAGITVLAARLRDNCSLASSGEISAFLTVMIIATLREITQVTCWDRGRPRPQTRGQARSLLPAGFRASRSLRAGRPRSQQTLDAYTSSRQPLKGRYA